MCLLDSYYYQSLVPSPITYISQRGIVQYSAKQHLTAQYISAQDKHTILSFDLLQDILHLILMSCTYVTVEVIQICFTAQYFLEPLTKSSQGKDNLH
jgi:hypothetical protein